MAKKKTTKRATAAAVAGAADGSAFARHLQAAWENLKSASDLLPAENAFVVSGHIERAMMDCKEADRQSKPAACPVCCAAAIRSRLARPGAKCGCDQMPNDQAERQEERRQ